MRDRATTIGDAMSISVVTPSLNQAEFLPSCLWSVSRQTRPAIEHLVLDPGSTDGSREIAQDFPGVNLIGDPDEGQAHAVGRGFARAQGDIVGWLNSDDEYHDAGVFEAVLDRFSATDEPDVVYGRGIWIDTGGDETGQVWINSNPERLFEAFQESVGIAQPAVFLRRSVFEHIGYPNKQLHFALDYDYWIRAVKAGLQFAFLDRNLAKLRYYPDNKTAGQRGTSYREICKVVKDHYGYVPERWLRRYAEYNLSGSDGVMVVGGGDVSPDEIHREVARLARIYNLDERAIDAISGHGATEPYARNLRFHRRFDEFTAPPWKQIALEQSRLTGHHCYTVGPRRFAFDNRWLRAQLDRTRGAFDYFREARRSDVCVLAGNGPSLNRTDFDLMGECDVFASNYAFLHEQFRHHIRFLSVVNYAVAEQGSVELQLADAAIVVPYWLRYCVSDSDHIWFVKSVGHPEFSTDLETNISWRSTVSFFNMQLAFGLGYRKVLLIGFDHAYVQDGSLAEGDLVRQRGEDVNHFSPYYFKDKNWQAADTSQMEAVYRLARDAYHVDGREIVNCTDGGRLDVFRRGELEHELRSNGS